MAGDNTYPGDAPHLHLPTARQVAAGTMIALMGTMALSGMPVLPVTFEEERRRQQDEAAQVSESSVGVYQTSDEAKTALELSQLRLADVAGQVEQIHTGMITSDDVVHAATRVFRDQVEPELSGRFRTAFNHVVWDTVDVCILEDNEADARAYVSPYQL